MFPVFKIPFILATTLAMHVSYTPPNPPPPEIERPTEAKTMMSDRFLGLAILYVCPALKVSFWSAAISEIAVIIAQELSLPSIMPPAFWIRNDSPGLHLALQSTIGMAFIISAGLLRIQCYRALGRHFTFEVSIRKEHQLVTTGPYSIVRHPSYTAMLLMYIGMILWFTSGGAWLRESGILGILPGRMVVFVLTALASGIAGSLCRRVPLEDELLKNLFKQDWEHWARRVPYALIPLVY